MSDLTIEYVAVEEIRPNPLNPKTHDLPTLVASFERFGAAEAVVIDERTGMLVSGHGRLEAVKAMLAEGGKPPAGITRRDGKWFMAVQRGWASKDDAEALAFIVAANATTERGGWNDEALYAILGDFGPEEMIGTGFDEAMRDDLLARIEEANAPAGAADGAQFLSKQIRSLIFEYTVDDFVALTEAAAIVRIKVGVESNAELFLALLEKDAS